jgi:hypothetical protein
VILPCFRGFDTERILAAATLGDDTGSGAGAACAIELVSGMLALLRKADEDVQGKLPGYGDCYQNSKSSVFLLPPYTTLPLLTPHLDLSSNALSMLPLPPPCACLCALRRRPRAPLHGPVPAACRSDT